jgi:hypothetical protein
MNRALPQRSTTQRYKQLPYNIPQVYMASSVLYSNTEFVTPLSLLLFIYQQSFPVVYVRTLFGLLMGLHGRAIAQAVSRWLPTAAVRGSRPGLVMWDFVVDKVALG